MDELTDRQKQLLKLIIEKYIDTAEPVGSETVERESEIGVSPATIRNEMVKLTSLGFLKQQHTSAGRTPTSIALKLYITELMNEKDLPVKDEVALKEQLWDHRYEFDRLVKEATHALANYTHSLSLATTGFGNVYTSGVANILDMPEFYDIDLTRAVLSMLDRPDLIDLIIERMSEDEQIKTLLGEDLEIEDLQPCGFVFSRYIAGNRYQGYIGVVGPNRLQYPTIIPVVRYIGNLISEVSRSW